MKILHAVFAGSVPPPTRAGNSSRRKTVQPSSSLSLSSIPQKIRRVAVSRTSRKFICRLDDARLYALFRFNLFLVLTTLTSDSHEQKKTNPEV